MAWPLLLLAVLFPLHLFSFASRLQTLKSNNNKTRRPWILSSILIHLLLLSLSIFALSDLESPLSASSISSSSSSSKAELISEVENLKLKIAKLESILEENTNTLNSKNLHLEESNKVIEEMEHKIQFLQSSLSKLKTSTGSSLDSETTVTTLEEEMENIVTEQWIQIRQLEQSLQMMKMMTSNVRKKSASKVHKEKATEFTVMKFIKVIGHHYFPDGVDVPDGFFLGNYISKSCISRVFSRLRRIWSAIKRWHYELQDVVKQTLEMNEFSAPLVNQEVVFFMASAIVVIPIMSAWVLLS